MFSRYKRKRNDKLISKNRARLKSIIGNLLDNELDQCTPVISDFLSDLERLDSRFKKQNTALLREFKQVLSALNVIQRYRIDYSVDNTLIVAITDWFLRKKNILKNNFGYSAACDTVTELIKDNLNIHKVKTYEKLYHEYIDMFDNYNKYKLFLTINACYVGRLPLSEVTRALDNFSEEYEKVSKLIGTREKTVLVYNALQLVVKLNLDYEEVVEATREVIDEIHSNDSIQSVRLILYLLKNNLLSEEVEKWIASFDSDKLPKRISDVLYAKTNNVSLRTIEDEDIYKQLKNEITNKDIAPKELLNKIKETKFFYADAAQQVDASLRDRLSSLSKYYSCVSFERSMKYWAAYDEALSHFDSAADSDTAYFFVNDYSIPNGAVSLPILMEAKKNGYYCVPTSPRTFSFNKSNDEWLNELAGCMAADIDTRVEFKDIDYDGWTINIPNKEISRDGINIYQAIYEFISRYQFTYFFEYDTDSWARSRTHSLIKTYCRLFAYIEEIENWAEKKDKYVKFVSTAPHWHNAAAYRLYCERKQNERIQFICVSPGYDNYYKNVGDAKAETVTALNLTKHEFSRNSFLGTKEGFEKYYKDNQDGFDKINEIAQKWLSFQRSNNAGSVNNEKKQRLIDIIKEYKQAGKTICLLNGKVIFDLCVKYTKGCVHRDMSEWITDTIDYVKKNEDILLLIKPHPHETRVDLSLSSEPIAVLKNIIKTDLGDNTIYLDSNMFKIGELLDYIDVGILWNGTSSLEFAAQGIPVLMCDEWGHFDYPIGFCRPESIEEYHKMLKNPELIGANEELQKRAIMFLSYMGSDDVRIVNKWSSTSSLNFNQFDSTVDMDAVKDLAENGCEELELLFKSIDR